jgi:hypothetical protein
VYCLQTTTLRTLGFTARMHQRRAPVEVKLPIMRLSLRLDSQVRGENILLYSTDKQRR